MNEKQELFAREYLVDLNATQAAIRAGYSEKTARVQGSRLLLNADIQAFIQSHHGKRVAKLEATGENVVEGLRRIAFFDARRLGRWGSREITEEVTEKGSKRTVRRKVNVPFMELVDSDELDDETAMAIAGIEMGPNGPKIRLADRRAALVDLGRHLGLFKDENQGLQPVTFIIKYADDRPTKTADEEAA